jgi:hypothetical protein
MSYFEKAEGKKFNSLVNDADMQKDLINFFTGSRYKYSMDDIKEMGPEGLADKFIDHMRWQESNETTVAKDLWYVKNAKDKDQESLESFGRLITAWDNSEGAGTGVLDGASDYFQAIATSPSTVATVVTAGFGGPVSKVAAAGAKKAGQLSVRKMLSGLVSKEVAKSAMKSASVKGVITEGLTKQTAKGFVRDKVATEAVKEGLKAAAVKGAVRGAAIEGSIEGGTEYLREGIREDAIEGYEKNMGKVAAAAAISGALGGGLGAFARTQSIKKQNQAIDILAGQGARMKNSDVLAAKKAKEALDAAKKAAKGTPKSKEYQALQTRMTNLVDLLQKRESGTVAKFKKPLDEEMVELGKDVAAKVFDGTGSEPVTARFTSDSLRKVSAATLDLSEKLGFNLSDDVRISQKVSDALAEGKIDSSGLQALRKDYGLTKGEFSLMFLTDMSEAGRTLNIASQIKKGLSESQAKLSAEKAKKDIGTFLGNLDDFAKQGITSPADEALKDMARSLNSGDVVSMLREADSFRIGMMTTQLATTAANVGSSVGRIATDASDRLFTNIIEGRNPLSGTLDVVKGLTWGKEEAHVLRILAELDPESPMAKMFYDVSRIETETGTNSVLARTARAFNTLNNVVDTQFKEAVLYASLQRQIRDSGDEVAAKSLDSFLMKSAGLDALPQEMVEKARAQALSFSYQYGYEGAEDWFGKTAKTVINANKNLPFVVSGLGGMPFPRYVANQMEYMHRHLPTGLAQGLWEKASGQTSKSLMVSSNEKIAKGLTGTMMLVGAVGARYYADPATTYRESIDPESGDVMDWSRAGGPYMAHLFIGDMIARQLKGEPPLAGIKDTGAEALKVLAGLNAYGYSNSVIEPLVASVEDGQLNERASKWLGDVAATLTMPAATVRDIQGQFNPSSTPSPYTRNLQMGANELGPQELGQTQLVQRALRFLPDFEWLQFASSFNGKTDVPLYNGFSSEPVQKVNPLMSQITGIDTRPKRNAIEREMVRLGIQPFMVLGSATVKNPNVDIAVRELMSKSISPAFEEWSQNKEFLGGRGYEDLPPELRKVELEKFISRFKNGIEDSVEKSFNDFARKAPRAAAGFIVNNYKIKSSSYASLDAVMQWGGVTDQTADEYIDDSETVEERLGKMQQILRWGDQLTSMEGQARK